MTRIIGAFGISTDDLEKKWCPGAELNHRHLHFQCSALPTELPGQRSHPNGRHARRLIEARFLRVQTSNFDERRGRADWRKRNPPAAERATAGYGAKSRLTHP